MARCGVSCRLILVAFPERWYVFDKLTSEYSYDAIKTWPLLEAARQAACRCDDEKDEKKKTPLPVPLDSVRWVTSRRTERQRGGGGLRPDYSIEKLIISNAALRAMSGAAALGRSGSVCGGVKTVPFPKPVPSKGLPAAG